MLPSLPASLPASLQALTPKQARLCLQVKNNIEKTLCLNLRNKRILVGLSGGTDSLALLIILRVLAPSSGFSLAAAHLDHQLRAESAAEALWCLNLCKQAAIPFYTEQIDVPALMQLQHIGTEEAARQARYAFYERAKIALCTDWLALGHHANDLAEDVLMRLIRGTGWPALAGMTGKCDTRLLFRPLLQTGKQDLIELLASLDITPLEDASNQQQEYLRNRVRLNILPLFENENPRFLQHITSLWHLGQLDGTYFESVLIQAEQESVPLVYSSEQLETDISQARVLPQNLRLRLWKKYLKNFGGQPQMSAILALDAAIQGNQFPKTILFPGGIQVFVQKKKLLWQKR